MVVRGAVAIMADMEAARCDVVRATSVETTKAWRLYMAVWRLRRPWRSGQGTTFVTEAYVTVVLEFVLEFVYIFQAYVVVGARRVSLRSSACVAEELGVCR
jgi:hypothetical protein